jgi:hypothetical protein
MPGKNVNHVKLGTKKLVVGMTKLVKSKELRNAGLFRKATVARKAGLKLIHQSASHFDSAILKGAKIPRSGLKPKVVTQKVQKLLRNRTGLGLAKKN